MKKHFYQCLIISLALCFLAPQAISQTKEFSVGAILPLTGGWKTTGIGANAALELAQEHIATFLTQHDYKMNVVIKDSQSSPAQALEELKNLHAQGIRVVVGPMTSDEAEAIVDYANENDILLISPSSSSMSLSLEDNLYRLAPNDEIQSLMLTFFMYNYDIDNVIPIYIDDNYGKSLYELTKLLNSFLGIYDHPEPFTYTSETTDFSDIIQKAEEAIAINDYAYPNTCVFFIGNEDHLANLIKQIPEFSSLRYLKWVANEAVIGSQSLLQDETVADFAFRTALTGNSLDTRNIFKDLYLESIYQQIADNLGAQPSYYSLLAYDALWLASRLYDTGINEVDFETLRMSLIHNATHFYGLLGQARFDENGDKDNFTYAFMRADKWNDANLWDTYSYTTYDNGDIDMSSRDYAHDGYRPYGYNPLLFIPEEKTTVKIGALIPLTGSISFIGSSAEKSLQASLKNINHLFNEKGYNLEFELVIKDTQADPDVALQEVKNLQSEGVEIIIGPFASSCISIMEDFVAENNLILISPSSTTTSLAKEDHILRLSPNDFSHSEAIFAYLEKKNIDTLIVLHRDDTYGQDFSSLIAQSFNGDLLAIEPYPIDSNDFSSQLQAMEQSLNLGKLEDTAILTFGFGELADCIGQIPADSLLRKVRWLGTEGFVNNQTVINDPQLAEIASNIQLTCSNIPAGNMIFSVQSQILLHDMAALNGETIPELTSAHTNSYDALWIAACLYQSVGIENPIADEWQYFEYRFFENLRGNIKGASGQLAFDENEDASNYFYDFRSVLKDENDEYEWKKTALYYENDEFGSSLLILNNYSTSVQNWSLY